MIMNYDWKRVAAASVVALLSMASTASAQSVTLKSADDSINITGQFVGFEDNAYILRTPLGDLRVAASRVVCSGEACPVFDAEESDVSISGSGTIGFGMMPLLVEGMANADGAIAEVSQLANGNATLVSVVGEEGFGDDIGSYLINNNSSRDAFLALQEKSAEVGMASRRITRDEARSLSRDGAGSMVDPNQEHLLAVDSIAVITHPKNPVSSISFDQLRGIFTGQIQNWSELGGPDLRITPISLNSSSGTRANFEDRVFGTDASLSEGLIVQSVDQVSRLVNGRYGGIGYVGYSFLRGAKPVTLVNECGLVAEPSAFSAKTEEYPLQRRLYLYTRSDNTSELTNRLVNFATSIDADNLIAKAGFIGFGIESLPFTREGIRARSLQNSGSDPYVAGFEQEMLSTMLDFDRLSSTFRFATASSRLDERGVVDLTRLLDFLEGQAEGSTVLVVGFTDSVGTFDSNLQLSRNRAEQVLAQIQQAAEGRLDHLSLSSAGFGEIAPSGCNADEDGRRINRRVEIWLKASSD